MRWRLAPIVAALLTVVACTGGGGGSETIAEGYTTLDGATVTLDAYRGTPVLVNFFASTCQPCLKEMPALEQVKQEAAGKVRFVGIDVGDTVEGTRSFVEAVKVTWDIGRDPDGSMTSGLGSIGLPTTAVLDANGHVVFKHLGELKLDQLRAELRSRGYL